VAKAIHQAFPAHAAPGEASDRVSYLRDMFKS
jgi:hypothetical protein